MISLFLSVGLNLVMWILNKTLASEATKRNMLALIKSAQDDGIISKANKDELSSQKQQIIEEINNPKKQP